MIYPGSYSQRDPRWASFLLGNNTDPSMTIGAEGCLITSLANMLWYMGSPETPEAVNNRLKALNGFINGGEVIWGVVPELLAGMGAHGTAGTYEEANNFVVPDGAFAVIQVTKPGFPMHFVLLIDQGQIVDPWDGTLQEWPRGYAFVIAHLFSINQSAPAAAPAAPQLQGETMDLPTLRRAAFWIYGLNGIYSPKNALNGDADEQLIPSIGQPTNQVIQGMTDDQYGQAYKAWQTEQSTRINTLEAQLAAAEIPVEPAPAPTAAATSTTDEAVPVPVKITKPAIEGPVTVVSTFKTPVRLQLNNDAIVTDLTSGLDIQKVPDGTVVAISRIVKVGQAQYLQTANQQDHATGMSEKYFQFHTPLDSVEIPSKEQVGSVWNGILSFLHKNKGGKQ